MRFHLFGMRVEIRFAFFAVLFFMIQLAGNNRPLLCTACCIIHELGHLLVCALLGLRPRGLFLEAGGMRILPPDTMTGRGQEALILSGGPLANLLCWILLNAAGCREEAGIHLFLAALNLLPLSALDGGQLLNLMLDELFYPCTAHRIRNFVDLFCVTGLVLLGIILIFRTGNFTLLLMLLCLI